MAVRILLNDKPIDGLLRASISSNNYFSCDSFSFTLAAGQDPLKRLNELETLTGASVELQTSSHAREDAKQIAYGRMDHVTSDPILGTFGADCRDLSAILIDSYLQQDFVNQTASEVVTTIANQHGLLTSVAPTQGQVGRYFEDGYSRLSLGEHSRYRSNWDLIVDLAREQNFDVYVVGSTLYFGPSLAVATEPVDIRPSDVTTMRFQRTPWLAGAIAIGVQTWDSQQIKAYKGVASSGASADGGSAPGAANFLFSQPNLSALQAEARAAMYAREVTRMNTTVRLQMPWDLRLNPRGLISLAMTGTSYDGLYMIDCIERTYCSVSGSVQFVTASAWAP